MAATRANDLAPLRTDFSQLIDGQLLAGTPALDVINPATGAVFASAPRATRAQLDSAVAAARRAQPAWRDTSYEQRRDCIGQFCAALRARQEELAELLTREQGKPLSQAREEIVRAASLSSGMTAISIEGEVLIDDGSSPLPTLPSRLSDSGSCCVRSSPPAWSTCSRATMNAAAG
jgi:hypothetical protein